MALLQDIVFDEHGAKMAIGSETVAFSATASIEEFAAVSITAFDTQKTFADFAFATAKQLSWHGPHVCARIEVLLPNAANSKWIAVFCCTSVAMIDLVARRVADAFPLHRSREDDQGFYRLTAHQLESGVLVEYEGGILLMYSGQIAWHHAKMWNDYVDRVDHEFVYISGERPTGPDHHWKLALSNGAPG